MSSPLKPFSERERSDFARLARFITKASSGSLDRALRLARDFDSLGHQPNTGDNAGRSSNGPADPTGNAVMRLNGARTDQDRDQWRTEAVMYAPLLAAARRFLIEAQTLENAMDRVTAHSLANPENVNREEHCANPNCFEVIYTGTGDYPVVDRCLPCHRHRTEHGVDAPAAVIAERLRGRERRAKEQTHGD